jgi:hypothetical protein
MISSIIDFFDKNKRKLSKTSAAVTPHRDGKKNKLPPPRRHGHFYHILV